LGELLRVASIQASPAQPGQASQAAPNHFVFLQHPQYHSSLPAPAPAGRILNIALSPADTTSEPPRLLNYLTAPHVLVWSAAAPCCPGPLAGVPQELLARTERGELTRCGLLLPPSFWAPLRLF
jgi:hypothetical protein